MALLKSLKKVLTELGGTPEPRDLTAKTIDKIADNISSGGGGANALVVNLEDSVFHMRFDRTAREIIDAMPLAFVKRVDDNDIDVFYLRIYSRDVYEAASAEEDSYYAFVVEELDREFSTDSLDGYPEWNGEAPEPPSPVE